VVENIADPYYPKNIIFDDDIRQMKENHFFFYVSVNYVANFNVLAVRSEVRNPMISRVINICV
jgi:hypothetical protein